MGKMSRSKGRKGQTEAAKVLVSRDWSIIETSSGQSVEDIVAAHPSGKTYSVEVKNHKAIQPEAWRKQAGENARKRKLPWMIMARIPMYASAWLILRQDEHPTVWNEP